MNRVYLFFGTVVFLFVMIWTVESHIPSQDPFAALSQNKIVKLNDYAESEIFQLKHRHVKNYGKPFDLGLFGNSRILSVSKNHLNLGMCSVFNFALSGQSFRSSVVVMENLVKRNILPAVSVISIDHFELQKYNNPAWLSIVPRWKHAIGDIKLALTNKTILPKDRFRILWRVLYTESIVFKQHFEFNFFKRGFLQGLGFNPNNFPTILNGQTGYRFDGSYKNKYEIKKFPALKRQNAQIIPALLEWDLNRLSQVRKRTKNKIILYESPLHAESAKIFDKHPSAIVQNNRKVLFQFCKAHKFDCYPTPQNKFSELSGWSDVSHPPVKPLGQWIGQLAASKLKYCQK